MAHATEGDFLPLIELLRSDQVLSAEVRSLIADLLERKLKRPRRRPRGMKDDDVMERVGRIMQLESEGWKRTAAVAQVAKESNCSVRTVQTSLAQWQPLLNQAIERTGHQRRVSELEGQGWKRAEALAQVAAEFGCSQRKVRRSVSRLGSFKKQRVLDLEDQGWGRTAAVAQVAKEYGCDEREVQSALSTRLRK